MGNKKILLGLTTTPKSNLIKMIEEIKKYNIKEIALFPTFLKINERKNLYKLLEDTSILEIPHVHLRDDMEEWEMQLFENKYFTKCYNIHESSIDNPVIKKYFNKIFIENLTFPINEDNLKKCAGLCLDFSHLEDSFKKDKNTYNLTLNYMKKYKIGCCHVSANKKTKYLLLRYIKKCGSHYLINLEELDYIKKYINLMPEYVSIELENSFETQLKAKEYLEKIING